MTMLAVVRILGLAIGIVFGMLLMAMVMAGAEAQEFPAEVRFLEHLPILLKGEECLENGRKAEVDLCEIRVASAASPGQEKAIYIIVYLAAEGYFVASATFLVTAADSPRASLPENAEVIIRGVCESGVRVLKIAAPAPCDLAVFRDNGREIFYLRFPGPAPGGILFPVLVEKLIFPSPFFFFKK